MESPASVFLLVKAPGGAVTTYTYPAQVASVNIGGFYMDILASQAGDWWYRYVGGPSAGLAAGESTFNIRPGGGFIL